MTVTVGGLLLGLPGAAAAEIGDEECKAKCPVTPPPKPTWTTNKGFVQCVEYVKYRSGMKDHVGNAWTWGEYKSCEQAAPGEHCVQEKAQAGTVVVTAPNTNQAGDVGHVAIVECVVGDWARLSEYNWSPPGVYKGDRCINVKAAKERGTPYEFLLPNGKAFQVGEHCDNPIKIVRALVKPDSDSVRKGKVTVEFTAPACSRAKYILHRDVYELKNPVETKDENKKGEFVWVKNAAASWSKPVLDVLSNYEDSYSDVDPCSQFTYKLERQMIDPPFVGAKVVTSAPMIGVNLEAVKFFDATDVPNNYSQATLRWQDVCRNYKGPGPNGKPLPATKYQITHTHGQYGVQNVGNIDGKVIDLGNQTRETIVGGLAANSTYTFSVRTYNFGDLASVAAEYVYTTRGPKNVQGVPIPQKPALAMDCKTGKVNADWPASKGVMDYELQLGHPYKKPAVQQLDVIPVKGSKVAVDVPKDGAYTVRLRSMVNGVYSGWTDAVPLARDCVAEAPTKLALADDGCTGLKLTWDVDPDATATNLKGFTVYRQPLGGDESVLVGSVPAAIRTFTDTTAEPDKKYSYNLRATYHTPDGRVMVSSKSTVIAGVAVDSPPRVPEITSVAIAVDRAKITFKDRSINETGFIVKRWTDAENGAVVTYDLPAHPGVGTVVWDEPAALPLEDRNYRYRIYASKGACKLAGLIPSEHVDTRRIKAPTSLVAAVDVGGNSVSWKDTNHVKSKYAVYRKLLSGDAWSSQAVGNTGEGVLVWADNDSVAAQYAVKARYAAPKTTSESPLSLPATVLLQPAAKACVPASTVKPEFTAATNIEDPARSRLTFKYDAGPTHSARVEYARAANGPWSAIQVTKATSGPIDVDVSPFMNQRIWLRLVGHDTAKNCVSTPSASITVHPLPTPILLPTLSGHKNCPKGLLVRWLDTSLYGNKFELEYRQKGAWQPTAKQDSFKAGGPEEYWQCDNPADALVERSYRVRSTVQVAKAGGGFTLLSASKWSDGTDSTNTGNGSLPLVNADMETLSPDPQTPKAIHGWRGGASTTHRPDYVRPNNQGLGERFGYYAAAHEVVGQMLLLKFEAGNTYGFKGWVSGGADNQGKVPFQIGYVTDPNDLKTFHPLATKVYSAGASWAQVDGVSYTVTAGDPAIGKRIAFRLGTKADGGDSDIWFDSFTAWMTSK